MKLSVSNESIPTNSPDFIRAILDKSIDEVIKTLYPPVMAKTIDKITFTEPKYRPVHRNTALNLYTLTRFIISMDGGSIDSELIKAGIPAKKSAFVQRRGKLHFQHFWYVFKAFNYFCEEMIGEPATFNGYHVFAVDGTTVNIARNPSTDGNKLLHEIATYTEPVRLGRSDERKIQPKSFGGFTYRVRA